VRLSALVAVVLLAGPVVAVADTLEDKFQSLKVAVANRNAAQVKELVQEVFPLATAIMCEDPPQNPDEKEAWVQRVANAKSVGLYAEYALVTAAIGSPAATVVNLISTLEEENPKSQYLEAAYGPYLVALNQTGAAAKVPVIAEKALAYFPENEDLLLVLADTAVNHAQPDRALTYANRLVAALIKHPKPEGVSATEWDRKRNAGLGRGYWISGVIDGQRNQYVAADKNLRAALPLVQGNEPMLAAALFYLGMANYQLGKMTLNKARVLEAARFSQQCTTMNSAFADQARHNAIVMKTEADRMR